MPIETPEGPKDAPSETESVAAPELNSRKQFLSPLAAMLRSKYSQPLQHSPKPKPTNPSSPLANSSHMPPEFAADDSNGSSDTQSTAQSPIDDPATIIEDDANTERGVVVHPVEEPDISKETLKAPGHDGYRLAGSVLSSFFWRSPTRLEAEKDREAAAQSLSTGQGSVI
jgi:hypothetical protein